MMSFRKHVAIQCMLFMLATIVGFGNSEESKMLSLEEIIGIGTSKKFEKHFVEKNGNVADLLKMTYRKTNIKQKYLDSVFLQTAKVKKLKDLKSITLNIDEAVDFVNELINHFKKFPNEGRKDTNTSNEIKKKNNTNDGGQVKEEL